MEKLKQVKMNPFFKSMNSVVRSGASIRLPTILLPIKNI